MLRRTLHPILENLNELKCGCHAFRRFRITHLRKNGVHFSAAIGAMDFFTVPTITFGVLYCFFLISHDRRRILHFNVTRHPTSLWVVQQLWEAFPYESASRFLIFDRDAKYATEVPAAVRSLRIRCVRTSVESPWQNGIAQRWVESCRRDLLDHVIALNHNHLRGLLSDYVRYYHEDRTRPRAREGNTGRQTALHDLRSCPVSEWADCITVTIARHKLEKNAGRSAF